MTTTEIRKIVASYTDANWFNSVEVALNYPKINFSQKFISITSIHKFLSQQTKGWEKYEDGIPQVLDASKQHFTMLKTKIENLEHTYEELLRLKKPAEYWNTRATDLKKEGWIAIRWLMGLVAIGIITLYFLLWKTPDGMIESFANGDVGTAIKWSVIYVTFISFLAYGIRVFYKIAFSAFHLQRDAEEREQLTYVYLSLLNDSAIEKEERNLILKSLFSRADTGLLKGDSSPVMPNNDLVGKVFGSQNQ